MKISVLSYDPKQLDLEDIIEDLNKLLPNFATPKLQFVYSNTYEEQGILIANRKLEPMELDAAYIEHLKRTYEEEEQYD
jgi:hypothetical protein